MLATPSNVTIVTLLLFSFLLSFTSEMIELHVLIFSVLTIPQSECIDYNEQANFPFQANSLNFINPLLYYFIVTCGRSDTLNILLKLKEFGPFLTLSDTTLFEFGNQRRVEPFGLMCIVVVLLVVSVGE